MKKNRFLCAALVIALLFALLPGEAFADDTTVNDDDDMEIVESSMATYDSESESFVLPIESILPGISDQDVDEVMKTAIDSETGYCALNEGRYEEYIDRIDLPEQFVDLYYLMDEGGDNDGVNDFLITLDIPGAKTTLSETFTDPDTGEATAYSFDAVVLDTLGTYEVKESDLPSDENSTGGETYAAVMADYAEYSEYVLAVRAAYKNDHPEVFWTNSLPLYVWPETSALDNGIGTVTIQLLIFPDMIWLGSYDSDGNYVAKYSSEADLRAEIETYENAVEAIVAGAKGNDAWKVQYFNKWLVEHNSYNSAISSGNDSEADPYAYRAFSALMGRSGTKGPVCSGYARAMKVLCDRVGIPCVLVDSAHHEWNAIKVDDGCWYATDTTWNDTRGIVDQYLLVGKNTLNTSNVAFTSSHKENGEVFTDSVAFINGPEIEDERYDLTHNEHTWDEGTVTKQPTIAEEGVTTYTCTVCGETKTEAIDKLPAVPQVSVSVAKGSASKKVVLTGKVDNLSDTEDVITGHGLVYITSARLGYKTLTVGTSGRTKVTFGTYKTDGSYSYTITAASKTTRYVVRAWATYTDDSGNSVTVYSDPITFTYNSAQ